MTRDRRWRRAVAEKHLQRVLGWKKEHYRYMCDSFARGRNPIYHKRNSATENIEVEVFGPSHFKDFLYNHARKARDNPKGCSCWCCGNIRKQSAKNSWQSLTRQERDSLFALANQVEDCDYDTPSFTWRSRKN